MASAVKYFCLSVLSDINDKTCRETQSPPRALTAYEQRPGPLTTSRVKGELRLKGSKAGYYGNDDFQNYNPRNQINE